MQYFCPYTGSWLQYDDTNSEHIIPRSLGGKSSKKGDIRVSNKANSDLGSKVDNALAKDPVFLFARSNAKTRSASGKRAELKFLGYYGENKDRDFHASNTRPTHQLLRDENEKYIVKELRSKKIIQDPLSKSAFLYELKIDHLARLKFCIKSLLGVNSLLFVEKLGQSIDIPELRHLLSAGLSKKSDIETVIVPERRINGIGYSDPFLLGVREEEAQVLKRIQTITEVGRECRVLLYQEGRSLFWSISVLGNLVGSIQIPVSGHVFREVSMGSGILLRLQPKGFVAETISLPLK